MLKYTKLYTNCRFLNNLVVLLMTMSSGVFMFDTSLFLQNIDVKTSKYKLNLDANKNILYNNKSRKFGLKQVKNLLNFAKLISQNPLYQKFGVSIQLGEIEFEDKLTILLIECICYYLIFELNVALSLTYNCKKNIHSEVIDVSPLKYLSTKSPIFSDKFVKKFRLDLNKYHFRRLIRIEENADGCLASSVMQDVENFLKFYEIDNEYRSSISEVVSELVDNAIEHGESDCLIDIDITHDNYRKLLKSAGEINLSDEHYRGINISIINISNITIGEKLKTKLDYIPDNSTEKYAVVKNAYKNHSLKWNKHYSENDFYILSSFQHKISGRLNNITGGTGLTKLLEILENKSDDYNCYMLSGNSQFKFELKHLQYDLNDWLGFNEKNDYLNDIPDSICFTKSPIYLPGTAYNLNFVFEQEKS